MSKRSARFREEPDEGQSFGDFLLARTEDVTLARKRHKEEMERKKKEWEDAVKASRPISHEQILDELVEMAKRGMLDQSGKGQYSAFFTISDKVEVEGYMCSLFEDEKKTLADLLLKHFQEGSYGFVSVSLRNLTLSFAWKKYGK